MATESLHLRTSLASLRMIPRKAVAALEDLDVVLAGDLLRVSDRWLLCSLGGLATAEEVATWRSIASLLEVHEMTLPWAQALVKRGAVLTVDQIALMDLTALRSAFAKSLARSAKRPSARQLTAMIADATALRYSGALMFTVRDESGPVPAAAVRVGGVRECGDERGHVRVSRVPCGGPITAFVSAPNHAGRTVICPSVPPTDVPAVTVVALEGSASAVPETLSELNGDELPPMRAAAITTRKATGDVPDHDLVRFFEVARNGRSAHCVSHLRRYEEGVFWFPVYDVPLAKMARDARVGDDYRCEGGELRRVRHSVATLKHHTAALRFRRERQGARRPASAEEVDAFIGRYIRSVFGPTR